MPCDVYDRKPRSQDFPCVQPLTNIKSASSTSLLKTQYDFTYLTHSFFLYTISAASTTLHSL
jgi:hypothetical protein